MGEFVTYDDAGRRKPSIRRRGKDPRVDPDQALVRFENGDIYTVENVRFLRWLRRDCERSLQHRGVR